MLYNCYREQNRRIAKAHNFGALIRAEEEQYRRWLALFTHEWVLIGWAAKAEARS